MAKPMATLTPPYRKDEQGRVPMFFHSGRTQIQIPDVPGGYIVSCGCGAGKTTNIKQLIAARYDEGVLYCVDTKDELEKMKLSLVNLDVPADAILMIHGDIDKEVMKQYQKNPEKVMQVPVLLITHCRLFIDLIYLFLIYNPQSPVSGFDGDMKKLMQRDDLRHWILLDETPLMFKPFVSIRHSLLGYFNTKSRKQMEKNYKQYIEGTADDFYMAKTKLTKQKLDLIFNLVPKYMPRWKASDKKQDLTMHFYTSDLIQDGMKANVIVFEGAGDILFRTSRLFKLIDIQEKYNTAVEFEDFDFGVIRKNPDKVAIASATKRVSEIITSATGKVLVVIWKNIGKKVDDEPSGTSQYCTDITDMLLKEGCNSDKFTVTYYGAANTKSTNEFRDYTNVILCGDWSITNDKAKQIDEAYMSSTSPSDQKLWYYVQLICRTAIRNHKGGSIKVWYSSDFSNKFIRRLDSYLNKNKLIDNENLTGTWIDKMIELKIQEKMREQIVKLNEIDSNISDSILSGKTYCLKMPLDKLFELFPKSKKLRREYKYLTNNLQKLGIILEIT